MHSSSSAWKKIELRGTFSFSPQRRYRPSFFLSCWVDKQCLCGTIYDIHIPFVSSEWLNRVASHFLFCSTLSKKPQNMPYFISSAAFQVALLLSICRHIKFMLLLRTICNDNFHHVHAAIVFRRRMELIIVRKESLWHNLSLNEPLTNLKILMTLWRMLSSVYSYILANIIFIR